MDIIEADYENVVLVALVKTVLNIGVPLNRFFATYCLSRTSFHRVTL
jgi:hypothetical protein